MKENKTPPWELERGKKPVLRVKLEWIKGK